MNAKHQFCLLACLVGASLLLSGCVQAPKKGGGLCQGKVFSAKDINQSPTAIKQVPPKVPEAVIRDAQRLFSTRGGQGPVSIEGETTMTFVINTDGSVCDIAVTESSGNQQVDIASVAAVKRWRFDPVIHDGKPVRVRVRQQIDYIIKSSS